MKNLICFLLLFSANLVFSQGNLSADLLNDGLKKYEVESAKIAYQIIGDASGAETFTFDRFGWRSVKRRNMEFNLYDTLRTQQQHELSDGKIVYRIDHNDSTYRKRIDIRWSSLAKTMDPSQVSESILFSLGGAYVGDSTLIGKTCQVWTFNNRSLEELWIWKGLTLKRKSKLGPLKFTTEAVTLNIDETIEPSVFELPEYTIKE